MSVEGSAVGENAAPSDVMPDDDASAEDLTLLANYLAGPGARPTADERERWLRAAREGRFPRRRLAAG